MFVSSRVRARRYVALTALLVPLVVAALAAPAAPASNAAIVMSFEKHWIGPGHYVGTIGDGGTIEMFVYDSTVTGGVQHFTTTLLVVFPDRSLTAVLDGRFNFSTARVALNGTVTEGWLQGARVHEESQVTGTDPLTFAGTVQLMPGSAH